MHEIKKTILDRNNLLKGSFIEQGHKYLADTQELKSVTTYLKEFFPFDVEGVSSRIAANRRITKEEVLKEWQNKAEFGTKVHEKIERYLNEENLSEEELSEIQHARTFIKEHGLKNIASEIQVYSPSLGIAGSIDWLCEDKDGNLYMVDWKTSSKIYTKGPSCAAFPLTHLWNCNKESYSMQLSVYKFILDTEYQLGKKIKGLFILHLSGQNKYEVIKADYKHKEIIDIFFTEWTFNEEKGTFVTN